MMPRMHPSAVLSSGFLLLSTGLSSCTFLPMFSSGGQETPRTLGARMEKHTEVLQKDIGARNASQPKSMEAAAKYIAGNFSDMGYAVTMQPVSGGNVKKGAAITTSWFTSPACIPTIKASSWEPIMIPADGATTAAERPCCWRRQEA